MDSDRVFSVVDRGFLVSALLLRSVLPILDFYLFRRNRDRRR